MPGELKQLTQSVSAVLEGGVSTLECFLDSSNVHVVTIANDKNMYPCTDSSIHDNSIPIMPVINDSDIFIGNNSSTSVSIVVTINKHHILSPLSAAVT